MLAYVARAAKPPPGFKHSPLMIVSSGYDGDICESWFYSRVLVEKYGFNLIIFDGPGQGADAVLKGTKFRYDWEVVVSSVIDHAERKLGFDLAHGVVPYGISFAGHLCTRASLHETRPHAYVLDPINPSNRKAMSEKGILKNAKNRIFRKCKF